MKVLLCHEPGPDLAHELRGYAATGLDIACVGDDDAEGLAAAPATAEVIWHILKPLTANHIAAAPALRLIQKIGVGVNTIDLEAARRRRIPVCNMPGTNTRAVAEMTLLLMLGALRRISMLDANLRRGGAWNTSPEIEEGFGEIRGRNIGLIGYGAIPSVLTPILLAMGASVCYWTREPKAAAAAQWMPLKTLLADSDIVSLHVPLTAIPNVVISPHVAWLTRETWRRSIAVAVENCRRLAAGGGLLYRVG